MVAIPPGLWAVRGKRGCGERSSPPDAQGQGLTSTQTIHYHRGPSRRRAQPHIDNHWAPCQPHRTMPINRKRNHHSFLSLTQKLLNHLSRIYHNPITSLNTPIFFFSLLNYGICQNRLTLSVFNLWIPKTTF